MRVRALGAAAVIVVVVSPAAAQQPFADGVTVERGSTRIAYWSRDPPQAAGQVVLNYGRPEWKEATAEQFDEQTAGKVWRMGSNFWSTLDTSLPLDFGGVGVEPGAYYLAVRRSGDGERWELLLIDPDRARAAYLDAYETATRTQQLPVLHALPLRFDSGHEPVERLTVSLKSGYPEDARSGRLTVAWGPFELSAAFSITTPPFLAAQP